MSGSMSRDKGQRAERAVIKLLQPVVNEVFESMDREPPILQRNTLQSDRGGYDIVGLEWMALEVKHQEQLAVSAWWNQTKQQAKGNSEPILFYKQNNVKFKVMLWASINIFGTNTRQHHVVEMSVESFLEYFRARLIAELEVRYAN